MRSGGEIKVNFNRVHDGDGGRQDRRINEDELKKGLEATSGEDLSKVDNNTLIDVGQGLKLKWGEIVDKIAQERVRAGASPTGANLNIQQVADQQQADRGKQAEQLAGEIQMLQDAEGSGRSVTIGSNTFSGDGIKNELDRKIAELQRLITEMRVANQARGKALGEGIDPQWERMSRMTRPSSGQNNNAANNDAAEGATTTTTPRAGTTTGAAPAAGAGGGAPAQGGGQGGPRAAGVNPWGMPPPGGSPGYLAAGMDNITGSMVADGLGDALRTRQEGRRLMLLLMYYIRMAESGDLGAMSNLVRFITWVIAKDKARQNIQISTKLIQLQEISKKALDELMSSRTDTPEDQQAFLKMQHKYASADKTTATSQKLLADTMQEFAQVVEALMNTNKFMLEAEGRVSRTVTRP